MTPNWPKNSASFDNLSCAEITGVSGVDASADLNNGSPGSNPVSISVTATVASDLLLFFVAGNHSANVFAFGGGFTLDPQIKR